LPTTMSSERALVTATLNLCTESKLQWSQKLWAVHIVVYQYQYIRQVPWSVTFVICTTVLVHFLAFSLAYYNKRVLTLPRVIFSLLYSKTCKYWPGQKVALEHICY
jgi:hypothetical protein